MSDNDDDAAGQDRGWAEVYATLNVSLIIAAIVYIIFEYLLRRSGGRTPVYGGNYIASSREKPAGVGQPFTLAFLDPPYHKGLAEPALACLVSGNWLTSSIGLNGYRLQWPIEKVSAED